MVRLAEMLFIVSMHSYMQNYYKQTKKKSLLDTCLSKPLLLSCSNAMHCREIASLSVFLSRALS